MKFKPWRFLLYVFLPFILILSVSQTDFFKSSEYYFYDLALELRKEQPQSPDIKLILIDDASLQYLGEWPLTRDYFEILVDALSEFGARAVVFDILFSEPRTFDAPFAQSIARNGNVFLAEAFGLTESPTTTQTLVEKSAYSAPISATLGKSYHKGHINTIIDDDGKIRKTLLYVRGKEGLSAHLSLMAACTYLKIDCFNVDYHPDFLWIDHTLKIPVQNFNEIMINYPGRWDDTFQDHISFIDLLKTYGEYKDTGEAGNLKAMIQGKVFFVGLTATGTVDFRANPIESNYRMLGSHPSLFNSLVSQNFITPLSKRDSSLLSAIIFLISIWFAIKYKPLFSLLSNIAFAALYFFFAILLLQQFGIWIPMFFPLLIIVLIYFGSASIRWLQEVKVRQNLEKELLIAHDIQGQFLVSVEKDFEEFDIAVWFEPAKFVAGDLYDVFEIDENRSGIFIGDVSGKGLPAALLMAQAISLFRIFSRQLHQPYEVLIELNAALAERSSGRFVTGLFLIVDRAKKKLQAASAGHEPLLIYRKQKQKLEEIPLPPNVPLGIMEDTEYLNIYTSIEEGDQIVLISDGLTEAINSKGREYGINPVKKIIEQNAGKSAQELLGCLKRNLKIYTKDQDQFDDITIIVLSI